MLKKYYHNRMNLAIACRLNERFGNELFPLSKSIFSIRNKVCVLWHALFIIATGLALCTLAMIPIALIRSSELKPFPSSRAVVCIMVTYLIAFILFLTDCITTQKAVLFTVDNDCEDLCSFTTIIPEYFVKQITVDTFTEYRKLSCARKYVLLNEIPDFNTFKSECIKLKKTYRELKEKIATTCKNKRVLAVVEALPGDYNINIQLTIQYTPSLQIEGNPKIKSQTRKTQVLIPVEKYIKLR